MKRVRNTRRRPSIPKWPVLIVKPHRMDYQTDERVSCFIMKAFQREVGEVMPIANKAPEFARNTAIDAFLYEPEHARKSHIFFLDADTQPVDDFAIERLLSLDKPVVCGVTPIKMGTGSTFTLGWNVQKKKEDGGYENYDIDELPDQPFKIDRVGGTTLLIKRHVLEALEKPYQRCEYKKDFTNTSLSEDFYFSQKLHEAGFDIWCDPLTVCRHYHYIDILDMMEVWRQAKKRKS